MPPRSFTPLGIHRWTVHQLMIALAEVLVKMNLKGNNKVHLGSILNALRQDKTEVSKTKVNAMKKIRTIVFGRSFHTNSSYSHILTKRLVHNICNDKDSDRAKDAFINIIHRCMDRNERSFASLYSIIIIALALIEGTVRDQGVAPTRAKDIVNWFMAVINSQRQKVRWSRWISDNGGVESILELPETALMAPADAFSLEVAEGLVESPDMVECGESIEGITRRMKEIIEKVQKLEMERAMQDEYDAFVKNKLKKKPGPDDDSDDDCFTTWKSEAVNFQTGKLMY